MKKMKPSVLNVWKNRKNPQSKHLRIFLSRILEMFFEIYDLCHLFEKLMLWWTSRYSKEIGKRSVPSLKDMMNDKLSIPILSAFILGILNVTVSIVFEQQVLFLSGQILTAGASLVFCYLIITVLKK